MEAEKIEYKETWAEKEKAGHDMVAFSNKDGGVIYFGVDNKGNTAGIQKITERTLRKVGQFFLENIQPSIYPTIEVEERDGKEVMKITIQKSTTPHHTFKGIPYMRVGSESKKMSQQEYQRRLLLYAGTNPDYSSRIVSGTNIKDLSPGAIKILRKLLADSGRYKEKIDKLSDAQLLKNLQLARDGELTLASLILLGTTDALDKHLPFSEIRYGYKTSEGEARNQDIQIFKDGYLSHYKGIWEKIDARNLTLSIPSGLLLVERRAFQEDTIREGLNNAIIHRDYSVPESIFVIQGPSSITIKSPGSFVDGVTIDNILDESRPRNKLVADIMFKCNLVEQFGTGVNLMFKNQLSLGKFPPNYTDSSDERVVLSLDGSIQDIEFAKYVLAVADEKQKDLSDKELLILNQIKNNEKIKVNEITRKLLELGLVESVGYGKYILARKYYSDTSQRGAYIARKRSTLIAQKNDLYEYFVTYKKARMKDLIGAKGTLFEDKLKKYQVNRLLSQLRYEEKIKLEGNPKSRLSCWGLNE